jgi:hypothetical protein
VLWTYQLGAYLENDDELSDDYLPHIHGMACAVTPDGEQVYLAGTAENGATVNLDGSAAATSSAGKDDIFVAQLQSSNGEVIWVKQMGTKEDDSLAHGRGIVCDKDGHAIILGNTRGSFLQEKPPERVGTTNDMMIIMVDRTTGEHMEPIDNKAPITANVANEDIPETQVKEEDNVTNEIPETEVNEDGSGLQSENQPDVDPPLPQTDSPSEDSPDRPAVQKLTKYKSNDTALVVALMLLLQTFFVGLIMLVYIRCKRNRCRPKRRVGTHSHHLDETQSSTGGGSKSNSIYHEDGDCDQASFMSGITLRPMPSHHGPIDTSRDTLLRLEPTVEPFTINRKIVLGQRSHSVKDAYDSLYDTSRCMSTSAGEGSDREEKERYSVLGIDATKSEIHSRDSFLDGLLKHDSSASEDQSDSSSSFDDEYSSSASESQIHIV